MGCRCRHGALGHQSCFPRQGCVLCASSKQVGLQSSRPQQSPPAAPQKGGDSWPPLRSFSRSIQPHQVEDTSSREQVW